MFFRKIDFLSPAITLYYKGDESHSSIVSGILTIIVYSICLIFGILYAIQFIKKENPQVYYYNRFIEDAGEFIVNSSSMFSFIQILDTNKNIPDIVDFDLLNIIGIEVTIDLYQDNNDLSKYNHWIYGPCNNSTDIEGIKELIKFEHFTESACIRKYYNKEDKKYYNINEKNFICPKILHGCGHPNRTFYGIIIEKCKNTTLKLLSDGKYCKPKTEIINYIKKRSIALKLIDQYTDMFNYTNPYTKYFYSISNGLFEESYTTNHLNFNPSKLISDEGIFVSNKKEKVSYLFDLNEKITSSSLDSGIYVTYYYWMQRRMQYYERVYSKIQDALSNVGGICSIILTVTKIINYLVNQFVILIDMSIYMNEIDNSIKNNKKIFKFSVENKCEIDSNNNLNKLYPPKKSHFDQSGLFKEKLNNLDNNIAVIKRNKGHKKTICINNDSINKNQLLIESNNTNDVSINKKLTRRKTDFSLSYKSLNNFVKEKADSRGSCIILQERVFRNIFNNKDEKSSVDTNESKQVNNENSKTYKLRFCHYICYLITLKKKYSNMKLYKDFRVKMISEENLILSNLNIDILLKKYIKDLDITEQGLEVGRNAL